MRIRTAWLTSTLWTGALGWAAWASGGLLALSCGSRAETFADGAGARGVADASSGGSPEDRSESDAEGGMGHTESGGASNAAGAEGTSRDGPLAGAGGEAGAAPVRVCGDGVVTDDEACDDGGVVVGDGCSRSCRLEIGFACHGQPSVCETTVCGNGSREGAETCDDGNRVPFDGCGVTCQREPLCSSDGCTSVCGDGLVIAEECDDGNTLDGDGCSATCTVEAGFTCEQVPQCEEVNGQCVLRVPAIFRDFSVTHPDFGGGNECGSNAGDPIVPGIAAAMLDAEGRPTLGTAPASACIQSAQSFAGWFRDSADTVRVVGNLALYDNGSGGYVNRFGANGEKLVVYVSQGMEQVVAGATSQATCTAGCTTRTSSSLQCDNQCRADHEKLDDKVKQVTQHEQELAQGQAQLEQELAQSTQDAAAIATLEAQIAGIEAQLATLETDVVTLTAAADACDAQCQAQFDALVAACVADCKPCSGNPAWWCTGGVARQFDGTPVFFPLDDVMGATRDEAAARLPVQYGYQGWPTEASFFPGAPLHNFYFTSEVQYWFRYETTSNARLDFLGDDDLWVFINGHLAVDLGGRHPATAGGLVLDLATAAALQLEAGRVYRIDVFHAERRQNGSSLMVTLPGSNLSRTECHKL